jgi:hypothetical protein
MYLYHDNIYSSMHTTIIAIMGYCKYGDSIDIQYMIMTTYIRTYLRTYVSTYLYPDNTYIYIILHVYTFIIAVLYYSIFGDFI